MITARRVEGKREKKEKKRGATRPIDTKKKGGRVAPFT